ncbi:MAG: ADP-ribosylation factor-like protein [Defluviitaleaceae bacterium]|nr:ADP-ribosylation factor-like protein [Defluviitaleaceae bacterium]
MDRKKFKQLVEEKLENLSRDDCMFFAWLCAVRALPFLFGEGTLEYWGEKKQIHLMSVLKAIDVSAVVRGKVTAANDANAAAYAAYDANEAAAYAARTARACANAVAYTYAAAHAYAAAAATHAANAADADARAARAAVYAAAFDTPFGAAAASFVSYDSYHSRIQMESVIFQDLDNLISGRRGFEDNISLYGECRNNLQSYLRSNEMGCAYWADWYARLFENKFILTEAEKEEICLRLKVPGETFQQGAKAVADYMQRMKNQGVEYIQRETRLIILGSAGAGKTSLVWKLEGKEDLPAPGDTTYGVDTSVKLNFNSTKTHVWDFGGQVIYHASHKCFMSANCVYVLVVNARTAEERDIARMKYWLDTVRIYSDDKAKVFIVINESDKRPQNHEDFGGLRKEYEHLVQEIACFDIGADKKALADFKDSLSAYIQEVGHKAFGKKDDCAMKKIIALFEKGNKIIPAENLKDILHSCEFNTEEEQSVVKTLFHELGIALSYDFMEDFILDPEWISRGVYKVIDYLHKNQTPLISYDELDSVFAGETNDYPKEKQKHIPDLMAYHKIGWLSKDDNDKPNGLIVPCTAPLLKPAYAVVNAEPGGLMLRINRDDIQELPGDFFYRYMCENQGKIKKTDHGKWMFWQTGMILSDGRTNALVELIENRGIDITVWGEDKQDYYDKLEYRAETLINDYPFTIAEKFTRLRQDMTITTIALSLKVASIVQEIIGIFT